MKPNGPENLDLKARLRESLLAQQAPDPARLTQYRKEIQMTLEQNERGLRRERRFIIPVWLFLVATCTGFLIIGGTHATTPLGVWFGVLACFWFLFGSVELLKHFINRARVDVLREVKGLELRVLELQEQLRGARSE
jgi:hypothetical protein